MCKEEGNLWRKVPLKSTKVPHYLYFGNFKLMRTKNTSTFHRYFFFNTNSIFLQCEYFERNIEDSFKSAHDRRFKQTFSSDTEIKFQIFFFFTFISFHIYF